MRDIHRWRAAIVGAVMVLTLLAVPARPAGAEIIHVEGFNDDGDGVRYSTVGRGTFDGPLGSAFWEHSFIVGEVAPTRLAPARRVGILWDDNLDPSEWTDDALNVWDGAIDWALGGKTAASVAFVDNDGTASAPTNAAMVSRLQSQGHLVTLVDQFTDPSPIGLDLVVVSRNANLDDPIRFLNFPVPVMTWNTDGVFFSDGLHLTSDPFLGTLDSSVLEITDPIHPVAVGKSGQISWTATGPDLTYLPLHVAPGATTVATEGFPPLPAVVALDQGGELLGGGFRGWEGVGFFAGQHLSEAFPEGYDSDFPRVLELAPVDVTGRQDVELTVSLAATRGFFGAGFLDVLIDPNSDGNFQVLTTFQADDDANLSDVANVFDIIDLNTVTLSPSFRDVTLDIPPGATELVVRFEAFTTFPNEVIGIDHVRITGGGHFPAPPNGAVGLDGLAASYVQDFDAALGSDPTLTGTPLPVGWSAQTRSTLNTTITQAYPSGTTNPRTYNVGAGDDRTLATGNIDLFERNEIQFFAQITGATDARAVRVMFDVEAWAGDPFAFDSGEAAYDVNLDVDTGDGNGFSNLLAFGETTTGKILMPGVLDGNDPANRESFDSGVVEVDITTGSNLRLTFDATAQGLTERYIFGVDDMLFRIVPPGDGNGDGQLDSTDLFGILAGGKYNHSELGPATWIEGDYNGDDLVNSNDLFLILGTGLYNAGPYSATSSPAAMSAVPEPSGFLLAAFGLAGLLALARRRTF